jgi:phage-related protein
MAASIISFVANIIGVIAGFVASIIGFFANMISTVIGAIGGWVGAIIGFVGNLVSGFVSAITGLVTQVVGFFNGLVNDVVRIVSDLAHRAVQLGSDIINGIVNGLRAAAGAVTDFLMGLARDALAAVKNFFGIKSPSTVMRDQVGKQLGAGLAQGIKDSTGGVIAQAKAMSEAATRAASTSIGVASLNTDAARGFGGLAPNSAPGITSTSAPLPVTIPIHIGDEVVRVVRTEIDTSNRDVRRTVRAGAGVTAG